MTDIQFFEEAILTTKRLRVTFLRDGKLQALRFTGIIVAEDWRALRAVFSLLMGLNGTCIIELSDVMMFDSTFYSFLVWVRLARETRGIHFAIVASERTEHRLLAAGVGKWSWLALYRDFTSARTGMLTPEAG